MAALLGKLRGSNDFVLVDSPPLLPVADSTGLAVFVDGVLLSVRYGSTRREQLQQAGTALERVGARTLGVVLNLVPPRADPVYGYGYGQGDGTAGRHAGR
jgi:receptor protein-tyrosine kinase